ncbi:MAG: hypothetical protein KGL11_05660 [Alphaproteobacteria bacterium]|nr:hypothetical protein [Alphaproteobacteria bacterium]
MPGDRVFVHRAPRQQGVWAWPALRSPTVEQHLSHGNGEAARPSAA